MCRPNFRARHGIAERKSLGLGTRRATASGRGLGRICAGSRGRANREQRRRSRPTEMSRAAGEVASERATEANGCETEAANAGNVRATARRASGDAKSRDERRCRGHEMRQFARGTRASANTSRALRHGRRRGGGMRRRRRGERRRGAGGAKMGTLISPLSPS